MNKEDVDQFLWDHRDNGCIGIKGDIMVHEPHMEISDTPLYPKIGSVNVAWKDRVTGESIAIEYAPMENGI